ncbi:MAG: tripartite tricarboxylate transporter substrate binding protein [Betaproteobacteria bacterium]|nr:tripartite tricarboxylate transporter substrate binding protein [Betaproteobacteria bacterium]MDH5343241.1 tripartite tricarboxylate transporter substrate binding protein [Betaproteobacteria bacterium]
MSLESIGYKIFFGCILSAISILPAQAQVYPSKPIRVVVPYAPGGPTDILTRAVGQHLTDTWGQQVILDNRPGNSGHVGTAFAAKQPADGYNFNMVGISFSVAPSLGGRVGYDAERDFAPVSLISGVNNVMVVHPSLPVQNVKSLLALARKQPGALTYASGGPGGAQHLAGEYFSHLAKIKMVHVPYKGAAPSVTALISGEVVVGFADMLISAPHVKSGRLRGLAVTGATRSVALPDLPTIAEAGLPGYAVTVWFGMLAPAKTPAEIINRVQTEIARGLKTPAVRERLTAMGAEPSGNTPDEFAAFLRSEIAKWRKVVKSAGLDSH